MYRKYLISALQPRYSSYLADILDRNGKGTFGVEIQQPSALYETGSKNNRMKTILSIPAISGFSMSSASSILVQLSRLLNHHTFTSLSKVVGEGRLRKLVRLAWSTAAYVLDGRMEPSWLGRERGRRASSF